MPDGSASRPLKMALFSFGANYGAEGDGALTKEELFIDKNAPETRIYESPAATSVGRPTERRRHYARPDDHRLSEINDERDDRAEGHSERMHRLDRKRRAEALYSSLPISHTEKEIALRHFEELDLDQFGNQKAVEKVALATVRYVVDQRRLEHDAEFDDLLRSSDRYSEVKDSVLDVDRGFMSLCDSVKAAIEDQSFRADTGIGTNPGPDPNLPN